MSVHLHKPTGGTYCGVTVVRGRTETTAYRSECTCIDCLATLQPTRFERDLERARATDPVESFNRAVESSPWRPEPRMPKSIKVGTWCVQTTRNGVTDDISIGWVTLGEAYQDRDRFLSHVLRTHNGSTVTFEDALGEAIQVRYPSGEVRHIDMIRKA